jgi:hypothetical protein
MYTGGGERQIMKTRLIALIPIFLAGCSILETAILQDGSSSSETRQGAVRPVADFPGIVEGMIATDEGIVLTATDICVMIRANALWEPGDFWDTVEDAPELKMLIDATEVNRIDVLVFGPTAIELDAQRNAIGSYPSQFGYCTDLNLDAGTHSITIDIQKSPATTFQYFWSFQVP